MGLRARERRTLPAVADVKNTVSPARTHLNAFIVIAFSHEGAIVMVFVGRLGINDLAVVV